MRGEQRWGRVIQCEPWLCYAGVEIGNWQRTSAYLRAGLGGSAFDVHGVLSGEPGYCHAIDDGPYVSPAADPAPWYVSSRPESGEFLGLLLHGIEIQPVYKRSVSDNAVRGGTVSLLAPTHRLLVCEGMLAASSDRGMHYGERWLAEALYGGCDDLADAVILPACPPVGDEARYFRTLRHVGVVDGPTFGRIGTVPVCSLQDVTFQLVSEQPDLLAPGDTLELVTLAAGASVSSEVDTAEWLGDTAVVVRVVAVTDLNDVTISAAPLAVGQTCPTAGLSPAVAYTINSLPTDHSITIDPTVREVIEWDAAGKRYVSGLQRLRFDPVFNWIEVPPCSRVCVTVHNAGGGSAQASITRFDREL